MDVNTIIGLLVVILMILAQLVKGIREGAQVMKQPPEKADNELVLITRPKPSKQQKPGKMRLSERQSPKNVWDVPGSTSTDPFKKQALAKKLSPQGEGRRFEADPGTLDPTRIVAPTIDPTVKPELESITGIYDGEAASTEKRSTPAMALNVADWLAKPEGIWQAVILAEVLNRPGGVERINQYVGNRTPDKWNA